MTFAFLARLYGNFFIRVLHFISYIGLAFYLFFYRKWLLLFLYRKWVLFLVVSNIAFIYFFVCYMALALQILYALCLFVSYKDFALCVLYGFCLFVSCF